jgi:hypothetical protein
MLHDKFRHHSLQGEAQDSYLSTLDSALSTLQSSLANEKNAYLENKIQEFAKINEWNMRRLPASDSTSRSMARMINLIQEEYSWLRWIVLPGNPILNRGYFDAITVSSETGLPWSYDFIDLKRIKETADTLLSEMPTFAQLAKEASKVLLEDKVEIVDVKDTIETFHKQAMKRNYLEQLKQRNILKNDLLKYTHDAEVTKLLDLGGESLWNIEMFDFNLGSGMFQIYILDVWQDNLHTPDIIPDTKRDLNRGIISPAFGSALKFGDQNAAWYVLRNIDEKFEGIHPVHVSKVLIGPFENKYMTMPLGINPLDVTKKILAEDQDAWILRASRQYSYAPNHRETPTGLRQIIHRENWSDEFIVTPGKFASEVSSSVLGTSVHVFPA